MSLHPDPKQFADEAVPHAGHRLVAAAFTTLPAALLLTATLWAVAGACATNAQLGGTAAMIFAGFLPFSMTTQHMPGTAMSARMRFGQVVLMSTFFSLFVLFGPGPVFLGVPCGSGPSVLQSGLLVTVVSWASWWAMRGRAGVRA